MQIKDKNSLNIYYKTHGEGEPIFLLHHGFGTTRIWNIIYPKLIEKGYQVVLFDRRGYGQSEFDSTFLDYYRSDQYRPGSVDEVESIRLSLGLEKINIIGQCEGGVVAIDYAVKYPQHTKSLVISSTLCRSHVPMEELNSTFFPKVFKDKHPLYQDKFMQWHSPEKAEIFYNQFRKYGGCYGRGYFDIRSELPKIKSPVLILYPDRSSLFEVEQAIDFYRNIKIGELAVLPDCGHNTYDEQPEEYARYALDFFKKHTS